MSALQMIIKYYDEHTRQTNDGRILVSNKLSQDVLQKLGITGEETISNLSIGNKSYLKRHRHKFYENH
jgi:hypothetical protein